MPIATTEAPTVEATTERYAYLLKTNAQTRRRVQRVQRLYNVSYNAALNILIAEALEARGVPEHE